ncbi:hypothetical protein Tco_1010497 [Tanacetum coccineum]|uniref:Uncharacterized protein n=1 Tax=Tanacetum coccineum TaxID=301880 RepID=A0ABQ5DQC0_9ASTR
MGLHTAEEIELVGFSAYWAESVRQIPGKGDLSAYWIGISYEGDVLGTPPSYTLIMDLMLRLCHRLIACSIAGKSQAPEKVTVTNLFHLRGMDVGSVNVPYLLARLLTKERLYGLTVIVRELPVIDMAELIVAAGAPEAAENAPVADEGALAVLAPVQAPQSPHYSRTNYDYGTEVGVRYTSYADFQIPYVRRTRRRTDDASTSTAQQDEQQLDP